MVICLISFYFNPTDVIIPDGVTSIGQGAFFGCTSLTDVYYSGSEEQWNAIAIGLYNGPLSRNARPRATIHYNSTNPKPEEPAQPETPAITFTDVGKDSWCRDAVSWAAENGVVNGYGSSFGPKDTCTRGQLVTFLHRALGD